MAERWQDLVQAHLMALGVTPTVAFSGWSLHVLLVPTFHHAGWLGFTETRATLELEMVVLQESVPSCRRDSPQQGKCRCWEDLVQVPQSHAAALRSCLETIDLVHMEDVELAQRDGLFVQCWYSDAGIRHSFVMTSPGQELTPLHHRLVQIALDTAMASVALPQMRLYLQHIAGYLS